MKLRFGDGFQIVMIGLGVLTTAILSVFFYREVFPEYKEYQKRFVALEEFRSSYTGERPAPFKMGIKQLVFEKEDKGPAEVERCISCHVALQVPAYNPRDKENYVWAKLDEKIASLRKEGKESEANKLQALKTVEVGEFVYDVTKVLVMHPLMEGESRPFEFHSMSEFGCVSCHNGNGRGLVTDRAHGPVFDGAYEAEEMGYKPDFLEKDIDNDPTISRAYNHKPGHRLLFQTSPIYVGALIQAKCVNCHEALPAKQRREEDIASADKTDLDKMLQDYTRGEELFLSQACYACHKISGFSRGGVGPELTKEGDSYPWFVKESIVWPQADLKTSTMPNYRLDHFEVEDLLTFLLAQKGERKSLLGTAYRNKIAEWEAGKKLAWEKPVPPAEIKDVNFGMRVFATEGCAACHRLRGYSSEVGLKSEEDKKWFRDLVGEHIIGSELARVISENTQAFESKIDPNQDQPGLLDELDKDYPGLLASFYPAFRFAERKDEDKSYQALLRQILMLYIQEYGLGRQIGPKPNWSGVYRSDKWLINHFKNPQAEIPRSIMPVFAFDETKFFALTHMLNVLGQTNRDTFRKQWEPNGFDPAAAYQELCSQCHGENLAGNGPVAEWIYPIPKNLRKAEFLRNLTRARVKASLIHGIKGTPMPPWGEVATGKQGPAVLTEAEIELLVDWLFAFLSGSEVIREEDVPKWQYTPEDIIEELQKEGAELSNALSYAKGFYAAESPEGSDESLSKVNDLFDVVESEDQYPEKKRYYIKKKYYTPENIAAGEALFWENCASCHGKEADGQGNRAEAMYDAKPRMLTNLNWLESRDDLRMLRSIKYGVTGTSMQPWGDMTSSKQRIQMVIYIRHLSEESQERNRLNDLIYDTFDQEYVELNLSEAKVSEVLITSQSKMKAAKAEFDKSETQETFKTYLEAKEIAQELEKKEVIYTRLKENLKAQKSALASVGYAALSFPGEITNKTIDLIKARKETLQASPDGLKFTFTLERRKDFMTAKRALSEAIQEKLKAFEKEEKILSGKVPSLRVKETLSALRARKNVLQTFKNKLDEELKVFYKKLNEEKLLIEEIRAK